MTLSSNSVDVVLCCYAVCALSHNLLVDRASRGPIVCIARLISWWSDWSISKKLCCGIWVASTREWRTLYCKNIYKPHTEWRRGFACEWRGSLTFVIASPRIYLLNCLGKTCIFFLVVFSLCFYVLSICFYESTWLGCDPLFALSFIFFGIRFLTTDHWASFQQMATLWCVTIQIYASNYLFPRHLVLTITVDNFIT